ncbi:MAG: hypothetical protein GX868_17645 [Actinobacteria bacterium]|nr:hypothetical protein [Actinomycetota bacterium]
MVELQCDAVLVPTDAGGWVEAPWAPLIGSAGRTRVNVEFSKDISAVPYGGAKAGPQVWLGNVGGDGSDVGMTDHAASRIASVAEMFVQSASRIAASDGLQNRSRPIVALPLIGSGRGGAAEWIGTLVPTLIDALQAAAAEHDADVVLCLWNDLSWSAVQQYRSTAQSWPLTEELEAVASTLAEHARSNDLVLFLGAGASADAGLQNWKDLLESAAKRAGISDDETKSLLELDPRDAASIIRFRLGDGSALADAVKAELNADRFGLTHALLASLRAPAAVTTNFDDLYERAVGRSQDRDRLSVLPYEPAATGRPWLLKLHGDLDRNDLVFTRDDYLGAESNRAALFGIVQALLVTKRLLFVGYSLSDEPFHRLVHQIKVATGKADGTLGTALVIDSPAWKDLWKSSIELVSTGPSGKEDVLDENARTLRVLLDRVAHLATDISQHLLDPRYDGLLSDADRRVAAELRDLSAVASELTADSPLAVRIRAFLESLGHG